MRKLQTSISNQKILDICNRKFTKITLQIGRLLVVIIATMKMESSQHSHRCSTEVNPRKTSLVLSRKSRKTRSMNKKQWSRIALLMQQLKSSKKKSKNKTISKQKSKRSPKSKCNCLQLNEKQMLRIVQNSISKQNLTYKTMLMKCQKIPLIRKFKMKSRNNKTSLIILVVRNLKNNMLKKLKQK